MGTIVLMHILAVNGFEVPLICFVVMYAVVVAKIAISIATA